MARSRSKKNADQLYARLVRGNQYVYKSRPFKRGVWETVTEDEREHLVIWAVDLVTVSGGGEDVPAREERQKFEFRHGLPGEDDETETTADKSTASPRSRTR